LTACGPVSMMPKRRLTDTVKVQMFSVPHLVVLFIVVLVFFGPHKLPELARGLGKLMAEFRKASNDFKMAFEEEMRNIERQNREAEWKKSQEEVEAKRQKELASSSTTEGINSEATALPEEAANATRETIDPVVAPVNQAVAREHESGGVPTSSGSAPTEVPAEEATSSDASTDATSALAQDQPAHQPNDQRQPA
jgi:sec-independent protein translocase protein TatB